MVGINGPERTRDQVVPALLDALKACFKENETDGDWIEGIRQVTKGWMDDNFHGKGDFYFKFFRNQFANELRFLDIARLNLERLFGIRGGLPLFLDTSGEKSEYQFKYVPCGIWNPFFPT